MEDKQLDFNAPLLSVRRLSSTLASTDGVNTKKNDKSRPNRQHSLPSYKSDWELGDVTKPASVPFLWERIPGRAKDGSEAHPQPSEESSKTPRLPLNDNTTLLEILNKGTNGEDDTGFESEDDEYSDALDTLSPTDSFSWNCNVSGLSGYDGPNIKPSGTFSADQQTRDFMMRRFLPAAKAMILVTPQYVSKKQPVVNERARDIKKVVSGELRPLLLQYGSNPISRDGQYVEGAASEDEHDEHVGPGKKAGKACGFFPRLCVKNSLCLLNPVPGLKSRSPIPMSSASQVRRMARTAYSGPLTQTHKKHNRDSGYRKTFQSGVQSRELHEVGNKLTGASNQFYHSGDSHMTDGSSPYRHSRSGGISPYRNEKPRSPFHDGARFLGIPKEVEQVEANKISSTRNGCDNFTDVTSHQKYKQRSGSVSPVVEKTLYIDSVNNKEIPILNLASSEAEGLTNSSEQKTVEIRGVDECSTFKSLSLLKPKAFESLDEEKPSFACISSLRGQAERIEGLKLDQHLDQESGSLECSKVDSNGNLDMNNEHSIKSYDRGNSSVGPLESPRAPPLPKSPSESWLWRTLPSISVRNPFSHEHVGNQFHPKKQGQKTPTTGAKWETIVKTSNVHHDHMRYSKELIPHVSQHSKT